MLWRGSELTYCLNVHPGETLADVVTAIDGPVREVKRRVCADAPFGLGLRLSSNAVAELAHPGKTTEFRNFLADSCMYAFTVNGFPYGTFHGTPVKDRVYLPDWTSVERHTYTLALAHVMAQLAPPGCKPSISTLPLGYRLHGDTEKRRAACASLLAAQVVELWKLAQETGVSVGLALEPEPHCLLETTDELLAFFAQHLYSQTTLTRIGQACGVGTETAADIVRTHLGTCLDTCHAAVEFETPDALFQSLERGHVAVMKVQVSSGLLIKQADDATCAALARFDEPVYLHQVVVKHGDGSLARYEDLGAALSDPTARGYEWRVHFHVPVHESRLAVFDSTQGFTAEVLHRQRSRPFCSHWEIETYTWHVLPTQPTSLVDSICSEFEWVQGQL